MDRLFLNKYNWKYEKICCNDGQYQAGDDLNQACLSRGNIENMQDSGSQRPVLGEIDLLIPFLLDGVNIIFVLWICKLCLHVLEC